jgi:hypothetical protein
MGVWQLEEIQKANLWVWCTGKSGSLRRKAVTDFWSGLLLTRPPRVHHAWLLTGTLQDGASQIGGLERLRDVVVKEPPFPLNLDILREATQAGIHLGRAFASGRLRGRLERGLSALLLSMQMEYSDESILALERALEGVLHPNGREQFVKRANCVLQRAPQTMRHC